MQKNYIQLLVLGNRIGDATTLNDKLLKDHAQDVDGLILRGQILDAQGHPDQAEPPLEAALKQDPQNPTAHYSLGQTLVAMGNTGRGTTELQEAVRLRPNMAQAYRALGAVALSKGDLDLLRQSADGFIAAQPSAPDGYLMSAMASMGKGNAPTAEQDLQKAMVLAPERFAKLYRGRTNADGRRRNTPERRQDVSSRRSAKNPRDLRALSGLVQIHMIQKQPAQAAARVEQQITKVSDDGSLYLLLGQIQENMKDYPERRADPSRKRCN